MEKPEKQSCMKETVEQTIKGTTNGNCSSNQSFPAKKFVRIMEKIKIKYHCGYCSQFFDSKDALTQHLPTHILQKCISVYCPQCHKRFLFKNHKFFMQHIESHRKSERAKVLTKKAPEVSEEDSNGDYYMCNECGKYFTQKKMYETHLTVHRNEQCECFYCGKVFGAKYSLKEHMRQCMNRSKPKTVKIRELGKIEGPLKCIFQCFYCKEMLRGYEEMKIHMRENHEKIPGRILGAKTNGGPIFCTTCQKTFRNSRTFHQHHQGFQENDIHVLRRKNKKKKFPLECAKCSKTYSREINFKIHLFRCELGQFMCKYCGLVLKTEESLEKHKRIHEDLVLSLVKCHLCNNHYKSVELLEKHLQYQCRQQCNFCGFWLKGQYRLQHHEEMHVQTEQDAHVNCPLCQRNFRSKHYLFRHLDSCHEDFRYICKICGIKVRYRENLLRHEHQHEPCYSDRCPYCSKTMQQIIALANKSIQEHSIEIETETATETDSADSQENIFELLDTCKTECQYEDEVFVKM